MQRTVSFVLNGKPSRVAVDDERMLLWVLRYDLGLTGTKFGCGAGLCGACTVIVGQEAVRSCSVPVRDVAGKHVLTIEGLGKEGRLHPIQDLLLLSDHSRQRYRLGAHLTTRYRSIQVIAPQRLYFSSKLLGLNRRNRAHVHRSASAPPWVHP